MSFRLLLLAHGSRDPAWRAPFERLRSRLTETLGEDRVALAYLEMVGPSLDDELDRAAGDGVRRVRVLPLFLAAGAHVRRDVPERVAAFRARHPDTEVEVLPQVGEDERMVGQMEMLAREAAGGTA